MTTGPAAAGGLRSGASILAVDDSPTQRQELEYVFEEKSFRVMTARDGKEALQEARALMADPVVRGIETPEVEGYWNVLEAFIRDHTYAEFTHGLCDDCLKKHYPEDTSDSEQPAQQPGEVRAS
jgi:hypothetical protein